MTFKRTLSCFGADAARTPRLRPTLMAAVIHGVLLALAVGAGALPQLALAQAAGAALPAGAAIRAFSVAAGPLDAALECFARTAGVNLAYDASVIVGLTSQGLAGQYSVAAGLSVLLMGSGIEA